MNNVARAHKRDATHERRSRVLTRQEEERGGNVRGRDRRQARRTDCAETAIQDRGRDREGVTGEDASSRERTKKAAIWAGNSSRRDTPDI